MTIKPWEIVAQGKQLARKNSIAAKWIDDGLKESMIEAGFVNTNEYLDTILPGKEKAITKLNVIELRTKISAGDLSSLEVVEAFCHRAALAHQILNCCSEIFFDKAIEDAKVLDKYFSENGKVIGPLHGIPISLKDQVDVPGMDSSIGYVSLANKPKTEISLLAETLKKSGAVFYVKTCVPTAMMAPETNSNLFGYTSNGLHLKLSCGGSSGGEGALIGAGGSPLGFGTDLGGSIRIPSSFQGLYALKPSVGRISYLRVSNSYSGQGAIPSVIGPMARSLEDIEFITKFIIDQGLWEHDPKVLPFPFKDESKIKTSRLSIALWKTDGKRSPHPPIVRALEELATALKENGHEVTEISFPSHEKMLDVADHIYRCDEGFEVLEECKVSGEPLVSCVVPLVTSGEGNEPGTVNKWWDLCNQSYECKQDYLKFWNQSGQLTSSGNQFDAIVCPIWPSVGFLPGTQATMNYSCPFNLLESSCVVLPITKIDKELDPIKADFVPYDEVDESIQNGYDPDLVHGLPVCLQVVGKKLEDEKTLAVASVIESCLRK